MRHSLRALLPIHALRESRALRLVHEQTAAHERALAAQRQAAAELARLQCASRDAIAEAMGGEPMRAADAQWATQLALGLREQAAACEALAPQLAAEAERALEAKARARTAHAARVRGHEKVREASRRVALRDDGRATAVAEQLADDDFAARWRAAGPSAVRG